MIHIEGIEYLEKGGLSEDDADRLRGRIVKIAVENREELPHYLIHKEVIVEIYIVDKDQIIAQVYAPVSNTRH